MSDWERLAGLELEIEDYSLEPLQANVSSDFERKSTVIHLRGAGEEGSARTSPTTPWTTRSCRRRDRCWRSPGATRSGPSASCWPG